MLSVSKSGPGNGQHKGKLKCFKCGKDENEGFDCNNDRKCCNCGQLQMASQSEKNITYPEACRFFVSATNDSPSPMSSRVFSVQLKHKLSSPELKTRTNQPD
jgi:hypothetical protein